MKALLCVRSRGGGVAVSKGGFRSLEVKSSGGYIGHE